MFRKVNMRLGAVVGVVALAGALAACGSTTSSAAGGNGGNNSKSSSQPWVIGVSIPDNQIPWRLEAENLINVVANQPQYKGKVTLDVQNLSGSGNVQEQIQSLDNMIEKHVNAIIMEASSSTALDPTIAKAHAAGIKVIAFDNEVDSPYAYNVGVNQATAGTVGAQWLVKKLNGHGNIILNLGGAGAPVTTQMENGALSVFKKYPGIHIIDTIYSNWDAATAEENFATALSSYPNVNGVWSEGGSYGIVQAFQNAHRHLIPMTGRGSNGFRLDMVNPTLKKDGFSGVSVGQPPLLAALALKDAVKLLGGGQIPHHVWTPAAVATPGQLKLGTNVFKGFPPSYDADFTGYDGLTFTVHQVLTGK